MVKNPTITETIRLNWLRFLDMYREWKKIEFPKILYMNLETTRLKGRPRNRWKDEVREHGGLVGGKGWNERVCNREEWKKLLRTARNRRILHMPMEWTNEWIPLVFCTRFLYYCQCSTCFGRFLCPSSGAHELYTQHLECARLACCYR